MQPNNGRYARLAEPANEIQGFLSRPDAKLHDEGIDEGIALDDVAEDTVIEVETRHHVYHIQNLGDGRALISGHPELCPQPVEVDMIASSWNGNSLRMRFLGKGAQMEFCHPERGFVRTSRIVNVRELTSVV
jgi:hypothetical protein